MEEAEKLCLNFNVNFRKMLKLILVYYLPNYKVTEKTTRHIFIFSLEHVLLWYIFSELCSGSTHKNM